MRDMIEEMELLEAHVVFGQVNNARFKLFNYTIT